MRLRFALSLPTVILLMSCGLGCQPGADSPSSSQLPADTIVIGLLSDIQSWNPYLTGTALSEDVLRLVYPQLAVEQADYHDHPPSFEPWLASSWEFSDDGLELTMHLDPRAIWSDGTPVSSRDVLFSHRTQTAEEIAWPDAVIKDYIEEVEALDPHTVRFRFTHRYPYQLMDVNDGLIIPAHLWEAIPYSSWEDTDWSQLTLAAGPFRKQAHRPQQELVLEANETYWIPGQPRAARVVFRIVPSQAGLLTQLKSGAIDFMKNIPPAEVEKITATPGLHVDSFADRGYSQVIWNTRRELFADARVRRALSMAIDRQSIIDAVLHGQATLSSGPILSSMWAFNDELEPLPYDPADARRLLLSAGWKDTDDDGVLDRRGQDFDFELLTNTENQVRQDICVHIQQQLAEVGVTARPRYVEWGTLLAALSNGDFDAAVHRWLEPTQIDLEELWFSPAPGEPTMNYSGYSNPEVDALISEANEAADFATQKPLFDRIQMLIARDQPYTFLFESTTAHAHSTRLGNVIVNDATPFFNLAEWSVDDSHREP